MRNQSSIVAFVVVLMAAWSQLGGVAAAQREPLLRVEHTPAHVSTHQASVAPHVYDLSAPRTQHRSGARIFGYVLIPFGAVGLVSGLLLMAAGSIVEHPLCWSDSCTGHNASGYYAGGGVALGAGALALISALVLIRNNPTWQDDEPVRVALSPTDGGAYASLAIDF